MRRSEQLINVTNVDDEDDHDDYNVDVGNCAEDFNVSDEPAISSSVSLILVIMKDCKEHKMHGLSYGKLLFRPLSRKKVRL